MKGLEVIIFDTETTGYVTSAEAPLKTQPRIIELFALKVDDNDFDELGFISILIDPAEKLSEEIVNVTGITDTMVHGQGTFPAHYKQISNFWLGEKFLLGHNVTFDCDMLEIELRRINALSKFPWPPVRFCTVELTQHYQGRRLKLSDLYQLLFGEAFVGAHRAEADVRATHRIVKELKRRGDLPEFTSF